MTHPVIEDGDGQHDAPVSTLTAGVLAQEDELRDRIAEQQMLTLVEPAETTTTVARDTGSGPSCFGVYVSWRDGTATIDTTSTPN